MPAAVANTQHLPPPPTTPTGQSGEDGTDAMRTTGPVEFVPEPPAPAAPTGSSRAGLRTTPVGRPGRVALALAVLAAVALELGLTLSFGTRSFWSAIPLWSAFATVAGAAGLLAVAGRALGGRIGAGRIAEAATAGLAVFWLLVVLPVADTDRGFVLTAALALLGAAAWFGSGRTGR